MAKEELFLISSQLTKGVYQRPVTPIYTRLIMDGTRVSLKTIGGDEVPLPRDESMYIDITVLRQRTMPATEKPDLKQTDQWVIHEPTDKNATYKADISTDTTFLKYPKTMSVHNLPPELSQFDRDEQGEDLSCLTLGKTLRESGIRHIQTENHGNTTYYPTSKIIYITESYTDGFYAIVYINENNDVVRATRQLF